MCDTLRFSALDRVRANKNFFISRAARLKGKYKYHSIIY